MFFRAIQAHRLAMQASLMPLVSEEELVFPLRRRYSDSIFSISLSWNQAYEIAGRLGFLGNSGGAIPAHPVAVPIGCQSWKRTRYGSVSVSDKSNSWFGQLLFVDKK